ncbi:Fic family protein [Polaromonas sp.]|uniref:Fic family protein n=1 Tax=Polaromonas sp. TaxID=1869339 RepID=UPI00352B8DFE
MKSIPDENAKRRIKEIYALATFIAAHPNSTASHAKDAQEISPSCRTSLFYYLNEAIANGWIERIGATKAAVYRATPQFQHHLAKLSLSLPVSARPKVSYRGEFMGTYIPNETYYLSAEQRKNLNAICPKGSFDATDERIAHEVRRFMADLTHNSSAFEGVAVKYADTISFLEENIESKHMSPIDAVILRNHYNAIRFIVENTHYPPQPEDILVSEYDTRNIHAFLSDGLLKDRRKQGRLRTEHVEIRDSCYIPNNIPAVIAQEFGALMAKAAAIEDPHEASFFLLVHIPYLQPFEDCNKRTARLICNIPLLRNGILPISWSEVNQRDYTDSLLCIYERNSTYGLAEVYVDAFRRSYERFDIAINQRQPSRLEVSYAPQIMDAVRRRILHNDSSLSMGVEPIHIAEFEAIVEDKLDGIRENEMIGGPYRLRPAEIRHWVEVERRNTQPSDQPN